MTAEDLEKEEKEINKLHSFLFGAYYIPYTGVSEADFKNCVAAVSKWLDLPKGRLAAQKLPKTLKELKNNLLSEKTKEVVEKHIDYWQGRGASSTNLKNWQEIHRRLVELHSQEQKGAEEK